MVEFYIKNCSEADIKHILSSINTLIYRLNGCDVIFGEVISKLLSHHVVNQDLSYSNRTNHKIKFDDNDMRRLKKIGLSSLDISIRSKNIDDKSRI